MTPAESALAHHTLGDLIAVVYGAMLEQYGDEELASVATAAVMNDLLSAGERGEGEVDA